MRRHGRVFRFLLSSAWELLLPDIIDKPLKLVQNVYHYFVAADPRDKLELLHEAENLSDADVNELAEALAAEWKPLLPGGQLSNGQRELLRQLVRSLHAAGRPAAADPSEALRQSLNASVLARASQPLARVVLKPEQQEVGRSLFKASLSERAGGHGPRPLPADAPQIPGYQLLRVLGDGRGVGERRSGQGAAPGVPARRQRPSGRGRPDAGCPPLSLPDASGLALIRHATLNVLRGPSYDRPLPPATLARSHDPNSATGARLRWPSSFQAGGLGVATLSAPDPCLARLKRLDKKTELPHPRQRLVSPLDPLL